MSGISLPPMKNGGNFSFSSRGRKTWPFFVCIMELHCRRCCGPGSAGLKVLCYYYEDEKIKSHRCALYGFPRKREQSFSVGTCQTMWRTVHEFETNRERDQFLDPVHEFERVRDLHGLTFTVQFSYFSLFSFFLLFFDKIVWHISLFSCVLGIVFPPPRNSFDVPRSWQRRALLLTRWCLVIFLSFFSSKFHR